MIKIALKHLIAQLSYGLDAVEADFLGVSRYHGKRVALYSMAIGKKLGYKEDELFTLAGCALLHDNALTEYLISERPGAAQAFHRKAHCVQGEENGKFFPFPSNPEGLILYHHEYADGSGAFGKKVGEYPQAAGIIAMTDQLDAGFSLKQASENTITKVKTFLDMQKGKRYEIQLAELAKEVLTPEFVQQLQDDRVVEELERQMPDIRSELTEEEVVRIAGITAQIIDYKSTFTKEHTMQIANKAWYMGGIYRYDETMKAKIYLAAALHDLGKLFIPTPILEKPGKLTEEEFETIKSHAYYTWECLHQVPGLEDITKWACEHHEKLDGSGYPFGKTAAEIDFISRLIACLDIYQAVREARPYHPERNHEETMKILKDMAEKGYIDGEITKDLDRCLGKLEGGNAKPPEIAGMLNIGKPA